MGYQDCGFYSRAVFIDFGINICPSYSLCSRKYSIYTISVLLHHIHVIIMTFIIVFIVYGYRN